MAVYKKPASIVGTTEYCPGCGHGVVMRMIAESIEELGLQDDTIACVDIACSEWSLFALDYDGSAGPHGRVSAVATGIKKIRPAKTVYVHCGDGCAYTIGLSETCYTAIRDIPITMIVVNNGNFGMTGGQMCPATTLLGDKTTSSPKGRDREHMGHPVDMLEIIKQLDVEFAARGALYDARTLDMTKKYIKRGFENQVQNKGFSIIEVLSPCPTNWHLTPIEAIEKVRNEEEKVFPLGIYANRGGDL